MELDMITVRKEVGQRLRKCREHRGLTQDKLSELVGITEKSYSNIERGHKFLSADVLMKLVTALDVSADYILFGTTHRTTPVNQLLEGMSNDDLARIDAIVRLYDDAIKQHTKL